MFRMALWITGALVIAWWITFDVLAICTCIPPRKQWDTSIQGHCLNGSATFVAAATPNVLIDLIILILPLPMIEKLKMGLRRKLALAGAFLVGYWYFQAHPACKEKANAWQSVVIVSIVRLVTVVEFEKNGEQDLTCTSSSFSSEEI